MSYRECFRLLRKTRQASFVSFSFHYCFPSPWLNLKFNICDAANALIRRANTDGLRSVITLNIHVLLFFIKI